MAAISKKLNEWLKAGLMSAEQLQAITQYEATQPASNRLWTAVMILGAAIMGLGVISLVAANWALIPALLKLVVAIGLLIALGALIAWFDQHQQTAGFETALSGFLVGCLAVLGLLGQVFNLEGQWFHGLLLWSVLTLPLVLFAQHGFAAFLWVTLTLIGLTFSTFGWFAVTIPGDGVFHVLPLLSLLIAIVLYQSTQLVPLLRKLQSGSFFWMQFGGVMALGMMDAIRSIGDTTALDLQWYYSSWALAAVVALGIAFNKNYRPLNRILLLAALALLVLYQHPSALFNGLTYYDYFWSQRTEPVSMWQGDDIRAPLLTLTILALYAIHLGNSGFTKSFNLITLLIGLRFLVLYFQAFGGLAATGVGLVISGAVIIGLTWVWQHYRQHLQQWTKGLSE